MFDSSFVVPFLLSFPKVVIGNLNLIAFWLFLLEEVYECIFRLQNSFSSPYKRGVLTKGKEKCYIIVRIYFDVWTDKTA